MNLCQIWYINLCLHLFPISINSFCHLFYLFAYYHFLKFCQLWASVQCATQQYISWTKGHAVLVFSASAQTCRALTSFRGNGLYIRPASVVRACMLEAGADWDGLSCQREPVFCCSAIWKHSNPSAVRWSPALMLNDSPVFFFVFFLFAQPTHPYTLPCTSHHRRPRIGHTKAHQRVWETAPTMKYMHLNPCSQQEGRAWTQRAAERRSRTL